MTPYKQLAITKPSNPSPITQEQIKRMPPGLIKCPLLEAYKAIPELTDVLFSCPLPHTDYYVDAKVHMLMPGQCPCIPNWHGDAVPRDADGNLLPEEYDEADRMFLWLSGPPLTEFKDGREVKPQEWLEFGQMDVHRGTISGDFQWRLFIRMMPASLVVRPGVGASVLRRHTQVYLDASHFTW
jgi:hypothetical protein